MNDTSKNMAGDINPLSNLLVFQSSNRCISQRVIRTSAEKLLDPIASRG